MLTELESESIEIIREAVATAANPVMLYSIGKDSSVMLRLAQKAFWPAPLPFPLLHIDTTWKFREMIAFRDELAKTQGLKLLVHTNRQALAEGISCLTHGSELHTGRLKTDALKDALATYGFDLAFGGARRDEERSRAKERVFSVRGNGQRWEPRAQRPELWNLYNTRIGPGQSMRVFPLSNWTESDVWQMIAEQSIPVVPLYLSILPKVMRSKGLDESAVEQMRRLAGMLAGKPIKAVYSSDLIRSVKGADIIAKQLDLSFTPLRQLRERSVGVWEGLTADEIKERFPEEFQLWRADLLNYRPTGGECVTDVRDRIIPEYERLVAAHPDQEIAMLLHGGVNRVILAHVLGLDLNNLFRLDQTFGALNIIEHYEDGMAVLKLLNG